MFKKKKNRNFRMTDGNFYHVHHYSHIDTAHRNDPDPKNDSKNSAELGLDYSEMYSDLDKEQFLQDTAKLQKALSRNQMMKNFAKSKSKSKVKTVAGKKSHNRSKTSFMGSRAVIKTKNEALKYPLNEITKKKPSRKNSMFKKRARKLPKTQSMQHFPNLKSNNLS
jgi:hypothetical protein